VRYGTYRFTGGNFEDLGRKTDRALDTELLVFGPVDELSRDCSGMRIRYRRLRNRHSHFSRFLTLLLVKVMRILWILAAGTAPAASYSLSPLAT